MTLNNLKMIICGFISVEPSCQRRVDYCQSIVFQSSEPLEMFHLEVVVSLLVPSAGRRWGTSSLILDAATQRWIPSSGASSALGGSFFLFSPHSRVTLAPLPNFYLQPPWPHLREASAALPVSPVWLCLLLDGGRAVAGWQLAPPLSPVISCVSLLPLWRASVRSDRLFWTEIPASLRQSKQALP